MSGRKQALLKQHRRHKRFAMLAALLVLVPLGVWVAWWWVLLALLLGWVAHEAWFADHLFYSPKDDYCYDFGSDVRQLAVRLEAGRLLLDSVQELAADETLILGVQVKSSWIGRFLDPAIEVLGGPTLDRQASSVMDALCHLHVIQSDFRGHYEHLLASIAQLGKPTLVCTIYDAVPGLTPALQTADFPIRCGTHILHSII